MIIDGEKLSVIKAITTEDEPYGIVSTQDGKNLYVTHEYPGKVSEINTTNFTVNKVFSAGKMTRGIALSPDEKNLFVTEFYSASVNKLDVATGRKMDHWKGRDDDNLARQITTHPTRPKVYYPHIRSRTHIIDADGSIFPELTVCDTSGLPDKTRRTTIAMDTFNGVYVVATPWETAVSPDGKTLYVIYSGTNDMNICKVMDDDYSEIRRVGTAIRIGVNPRAIRVNPNGKEVYVYNALQFDVTIHAPTNMNKLASMKSCDPPKSPEWVRGKILFNTSNSPMTSRRWVACFSCHPDGNSDGRIWENPEGLRKTPPMAGLAHTHPLHWSADRDEVQDFEYTIRGKLMQGFGLTKGALTPKIGFEKTELKENLSNKSADLDALAIYTNSFGFTLSPHIEAPGKLTKQAERGKSIFFNNQVGCASCHSGPYYSDSQLGAKGKIHNVGTGNDDPSEKMGPEYDTPTLLGLYRNAPYLHHGKAKTLMDVLTTQNLNDKHGKTSHLSISEKEDLVEFLKALPYEMPPDETPNTVKFRFTPKK
ncbi:MAG: hypothetical protein EBQ87_03750 [Planctomycetes bacterium]|nr:hypothetical protein [Planctomycetota bacterium]